MIAGILLAAGGSSRLGRPKQLVEIDGRSLVLRAADALHEAGCTPLLVVIGAAHEQVARQLATVPVELVVHPEWREGMAGSLRAGVRALLDHPNRPRVRAVLVAGCDQPAMDVTVVRRLLTAFDAMGGGPGLRIGSEYAGTVGIPACFEASLLPRLLELRGDLGAKSLLLGPAAQIARIPFSEGARDVDTPDDLRR